MIPLNSRYETSGWSEDSTHENERREEKTESEVNERLNLSQADFDLFSTIRPVFSALKTLFRIITTTIHITIILSLSLSLRVSSSTTSWSSSVR